ncbi:MAG: hypothetical protein M3Y65_20375 [Pseudomonadota bacterium]|nr:hypothetical protein [Pseudomonadota bacterium]
MGRATITALDRPAYLGFVAVAGAGHRSTASTIASDHGAGHRPPAAGILSSNYQLFIQIGSTMNFSLSFLENNVAIDQDTWTALVTTGSDMSLASVRTAIMAVLEQDGTFTVEDASDQVVRRIETSSEFEGFMQEVEMQRDQFQQEQAQ